MRSWALALGLLLAAPAGVGLAALTDTDCTTLDVEHAEEAVVDHLLAAGWTGDPTDGREALTYCEVTP